MSANDSYFISLASVKRTERVVYRPKVFICKHF